MFAILHDTKAVAHLSFLLMLAALPCALSKSSSEPTKTCYNDEVPPGAQKKCNDLYPGNDNASLSEDTCKAVFEGTACDLDNTCKYCGQDYASSEQTALVNQQLIKCDKNKFVNLKDLTDRCPSHIIIYIALATILLMIAILAAVLLYIFCNEGSEVSEKSEKQPKMVMGKAVKGGKVAKSSVAGKSQMSNTGNQLKQSVSKNSANYSLA